MIRVSPLACARGRSDDSTRPLYTGRFASSFLVYLLNSLACCTCCVMGKGDQVVPELLRGGMLAFGAGVWVSFLYLCFWCSSVIHQQNGLRASCHLSTRFLRDREVRQVR